MGAFEYDNYDINYKQFIYKSDTRNENSDCLLSTAHVNKEYSNSIKKTSSRIENPVRFVFSVLLLLKWLVHCRSSKAQCLLNVPRDTISHDLMKSPPGKMFDANDQCKMAFGPKSKFCEVCPFY